MRERLLAETRARTALSAISVTEQRLFLSERLLRDNDVASMASSLEQRVPLVDQVLFESVDCSQQFSFQLKAEDGAAT
jgi:asparagine synthase (glutamine-hydrolysing)